MEKYFKKTTYRLTTLLIGLVLGCSLFVSCVEENPYTSKEPEWLGSSIYDYLATDGNYTTYVKLIDELGYTEILKKTGSKTLFVASDSAFNVFFNSNDVKVNPWGVKSYQGLTLAQKKLILNFTMINNAYTSDNLANYNNGGGLQLGAAMRRETAVSIYDSVPHDYNNDVPSGKYWNKYKTNGIYILKDNTSLPIVQFTQNKLDQSQMSDADFKYLTGTSRVKNDIHIFGVKVIKRDVICKNGYINILEKVVIPPMNMAEFIKTNPNTQIFSKLLERFSAPYYNYSYTRDYKVLQLSHPELPYIDSLFVKLFFTGLGADIYPNGTNIPQELFLPFDPGFNSYSPGALQTDMGAMFVPTDAAMADYINNGIFKDYGSWDNVPDQIIMSFLRRHMKSSLIASVPSRFGKMLDSENSLLPVKETDISPGNVYLGVNGVVSVTNKVYPPDEYASVYAPVMLSESTRVFDWFINNYNGGVYLYRFYLRSLINTYSFFVPTDDAFTKYIDPIAYNTNTPAVLKFWFNQKTKAVNATVYKYDKTNDLVGDSVDIIIPSRDTKVIDIIKNRLLDIIESSIIVHKNKSESDNLTDNYYISKGNNTIKINGSGSGMTIEGGDDKPMGVNVSRIFSQSNGKTYFIDKPIQTPLSSVSKKLKNTPEFNEFNALLDGFAPDVIYAKLNSNFSLRGADRNIKFLNTYNYTVYVPTNQAIIDAIASKIITPWESRLELGVVGINDMPETTLAEKALKAKAKTTLERFIRYHFQDNSVFVGGKTITNQLYQTATKNDGTETPIFKTAYNKFYKILVNSNGSNLTLSTENGGGAQVVTDNGLYNIMVRDFIFNFSPDYFKTIDGVGVAGREFSTSKINTSSTAVIHQINKVLSFQ